jgi:hypothetical protein
VPALRAEPILPHVDEELEPPRSDDPQEALGDDPPVPIDAAHGQGGPRSLPERLREASILASLYFDGVRACVTPAVAQLRGGALDGRWYERKEPEQKERRRPHATSSFTISL